MATNKHLYFLGATTTERANRRAYQVICRAHRLWEISRGYTEEALARLEGKWILTTKTNDGRRTLHTDTFAMLGLNASDYEGGSFNLDLLNATLSGVRAHGDTFNYLCTKCGILTDAQHKCGEVRCTDCGARLTTTTEKEARLCSECNINAKARIHPYHGRPSRFSATRFERPHLRDSYAHLGIELEIDSTNGSRTQSTESTRAIYKALNADPFLPVWEFESDSSIRGFECISQPKTLKGWNAEATRLGEAYAEAIRFSGQFAKGNGLHIHIDRAYFGEVGSEARDRGALLLSYMVYRYFAFWKAISGRENSEDIFHYTRGKEVKGIASTAMATATRSHFDAVNLSGENTIEVRIFGGHIDNEESFLAVVDIVNALARWAKTAGLGQAETMKPSHIVRYINNPERVKTFIENPNAHAFTSREAEAIKADFITTLTKKIGG